MLTVGVELRWRAGHHDSNDTAKMGYKSSEDGDCDSDYLACLTGKRAKVQNHHTEYFPVPHPGFPAFRAQPPASWGDHTGSIRNPQGQGDP